MLRATRLLLSQTPNVTIVIGAHAAEVGLQLKGLPVRIKRNKDWRLGMGGSIASGMSLISDEPDGVLIMLSDQWRISQQDLKTWWWPGEKILQNPFSPTGRKVTGLRQYCQGACSMICSNYAVTGEQNHLLQSN